MRFRPVQSGHHLHADAGDRVVQYPAAPCGALLPTDRIPSHTGKRELAPQVHGNPSTRKAICDVLWKGTLTFIIFMVLPHLQSFASVLSDLTGFPFDARFIFTSPGVGCCSRCIGAMCVGRSFELTAGSPKPSQQTVLNLWALVRALLGAVWVPPFNTFQIGRARDESNIVGTDGFHLDTFWIVFFPLTDLHRNSFSPRLALRHMQALPGHSIELGKLRSYAIGSNQRNSA